MSKRWAGFLLALALAGCNAVALHGPLPLAGSSGAGALTDERTCQQRDNDTVVKLEQCIQRAALWRYLSQFQKIADANPGPKGHGNRDTGTPGYKASVDYVAGLMRAAGYHVKIQAYNYRHLVPTGTPTFAYGSHAYVVGDEWFPARNSVAGTVTARVEPPRGHGCDPGDFAGFTRGNVALIERSGCDGQTLVENAQAAGASAAVLYSSEPVAHQERLLDAPPIPVVGVTTNAVGAELLRDYRAGKAPVVHIDIHTETKSGIDYNLIADSPYGNADQTVIVEGHLDSIFGAGMLDNASGSTTILDIALNLAKTPTRNHLRYIWFGGEEIGLLGSRYYTETLPGTERRKIAFDLDADVTATPNYDILIADPGHASQVKKFPKNVVPQSQIGNELFKDFFRTGGVISRLAGFGNDGTDSLSFSFIGIPNTGILTQQDCCKHEWEKKLWGGFHGNYEGKVPGYNGGCVDTPGRWCDNLSNNDEFVLELASKAVAYATFKLANHHFK